MRHRYECPVRWADLDLLGHVNNVTYVDYLQEGRVDFMRALGVRWSGVEDGMVVVRTIVDYLEPMTFHLRPVTVECWVSEIRSATFTMSYEIFDDHEGEPRVHARASTVLAPFVFATQRPRRLTAAERDRLTEVWERADGADSEPVRRTPWGSVPSQEAGHYPLHVRFSDTDAYGHVNNVHYLEYFQEARIPWFGQVAQEFEEARGLRMVVARAEIDYRGQLVPRETPYDCWTWLEGIGRTSLTVRSEIVDWDAVLSRGRTVLVCWDPEAGRSIEPPDRLRAALEARVTPSC